LPAYTIAQFAGWLVWCRSHCGRLSGRNKPNRNRASQTLGSADTIRFLVPRRYARTAHRACPATRKTDDPIRPAAPLLLTCCSSAVRNQARTTAAPDPDPPQGGRAIREIQTSNLEPVRTAGTYRCPSFGLQTQPVLDWHHLYAE
jgi:hypothetical protein